MNHTSEAIQDLANVIETALSELDLKGQDSNISQAMSIVREAFSGFIDAQPFPSPGELVLKAREHTPDA